MLANSLSSLYVHVLTVTHRSSMCNKKTEVSYKPVHTTASCLLVKVLMCGNTVIKECVPNMNKGHLLCLQWQVLQPRVTSILGTRRNSVKTYDKGRNVLRTTFLDNTTWNRTEKFVMYLLFVHTHMWHPLDLHTVYFHSRNAYCTDNKTHRMSIMRPGWVWTGSNEFCSTKFNEK
jgi:hypothetical protein